MVSIHTTRRLLLYEWLGFGLMTLVLWLDELLDLPHLLLGSPRTPVNIGESLIETAMLLPLAGAVAWLTSHLMHRVKHLEGLMHICSSCHRVRDGDEWVSLEEYLHSHSQAELEPSLCRRCLLEQFTEPAGNPPGS